jgi:hypothetical protein
MVMGEKPKQAQQCDQYGGAIVEAKRLNERLDELMRKRRLAPASVRSCQAGEKLPSS